MTTSSSRSRPWFPPKCLVATAMQVSMMLSTQVQSTVNLQTDNNVAVPAVSLQQQLPVRTRATNLMLKPLQNVPSQLPQHQITSQQQTKNAIVVEQQSEATTAESRRHATGQQGLQSFRTVLVAPQKQPVTILKKCVRFESVRLPEEPASMWLNTATSVGLLAQQGVEQPVLNSPRQEYNELQQQQQQQQQQVPYTQQPKQLGIRHQELAQQLPVQQPTFCPSNPQITVHVTNRKNTTPVQQLLNLPPAMVEQRVHQQQLAPKEAVKVNPVVHVIQGGQHHNQQPIQMQPKQVEPLIKLQDVNQQPQPARIDISAVANNCGSNIKVDVQRYIAILPEALNLPQALPQLTDVSSGFQVQQVFQQQQPAVFVAEKQLPDLFHYHGDIITQPHRAIEQEQHMVAKQIIIVQHPHQRQIYQILPADRYVQAVRNTCHYHKHYHNHNSRECSRKKRSRHLHGNASPGNRQQRCKTRNSRCYRCLRDKLRFEHALRRRRVRSHKKDDFSSSTI